MAATTMTVENYVADIVESIIELDTDCLAEIHETLLKMKCSSKIKHRMNYWRVQQCLGEIAVDVLVKYLNKISKSARKRKAYFKYFDVLIIMNLLLDSLSNIAVIKRLLLFKTKLSPLLFQALRQSDEDELTAIGFLVMYRLLIVGKQEVGDYLVKFGILKDIYVFIKRRVDCEVYTKEVTKVITDVTICSKLLRCIAECGSDSIRKQIRFSAAMRCVSEYVTKLREHSITYPAMQHLVEDLSQIALVVTDDKTAQAARDTWQAKERLMEHLQVIVLYLFCSSPSCRKMYIETAMEKFRYCGACRLARYCSEDCQKAHWREGHKKACLGEALPGQLT